MNEKWKISLSWTAEELRLERTYGVINNGVKNRLVSGKISRAPGGF